MVTLETKHIINKLNLINSYVNLSLKTNDKNKIKHYNKQIEHIEKNK